MEKELLFSQQNGRVILHFYRVQTAKYGVQYLYTVNNRKHMHNVKTAYQKGKLDKETYQAVLNNGLFL